MVINKQQQDFVGALRMCSDVVNMVDGWREATCKLHENE